MATSANDSELNKRDIILDADADTDAGAIQTMDSGCNTIAMDLTPPVYFRTTQVAVGIKLTTISPYPVVKKPDVAKLEYPKPTDIECFIKEQIGKFDKGMTTAQLLRAKIEKKGLSSLTVGAMQDALDTMVLCFQELEDVV